MEQQQTNLAKVTNAFNNGLRLTVVSALAICNTSELRCYVTQLIRQGVNIKSEWRTNNGKRFKLYWLEKDKINVDYTNVKS